MADNVEVTKSKPERYLSRYLRLIKGKHNNNNNNSNNNNNNYYYNNNNNNK